MAENNHELEKRKESLIELRTILSRDVSACLALAEELAGDEREIIEKMGWWIYVLRSGSISKTLKLESTPEMMLGFMEKLEKALDSLRNTNANTRLVLENLFLSA